MLVLSADGKGIVMRPDALRPATAKAAGQATAKLATRLSKGEKRNRKRMAEVGAVYDLTPVPAPRRRHPAARPTPNAPPPAGGPQATNKWLTASVVAGRRHGHRRRSSTRPTAATPTTPAPGSRSSTATTTRSTGSHAEAHARGVTVTIADRLHPRPGVPVEARPGPSSPKATPPPRPGCATKPCAVLRRQGPPGRRRASGASHQPPRLTPATRTERRRVRHLPDQQGALPGLPHRAGRGWPIATGVIEGACRHLVARPDGHHRRPLGPRTAPKPSSNSEPSAANGDFDDYWTLPPRPKNANASTSPATPTTTSHKPPDVTPEEPHPIHSDLAGRVSERRKVLLTWENEGVEANILP